MHRPDVGIPGSASRAIDGGQQLSRSALLALLNYAEIGLKLGLGPSRWVLLP